MQEVDTVSIENAPSISWQEDPLPKSRLKGQPKSLSYSFALRGSGKSSYDIAGLSNNCQQVLCQNETEICVFQFDDVGLQLTSLNFRKILEFELVGTDKTRSEEKGMGRLIVVRQNKEELIRHATLSERFLAITTSSRLLVLKTASATLFDEGTHGEWDSSALTIFEKGVYLIVVLGRARRLRTGQFEGQITIFTYIIGRGFEKSLTTQNLALPEPDFPRHLILSTDGKLLSCVTGIQNKIFVWSIGKQFASSEELFAFSKNRYVRVRSTVGHSCSVCY